MKSVLRSASLVLLVLLVPATALWVHRTEMTHLWWILPGSAAVALFLFGLWYLAFGSAPAKVRMRRFAIALAGVVGAGALGASLLRYEGSTSGSSFPKFSWVWSKSAPPAAPPLDATSAAEGSPTLPRDAVADLETFLGPDRDGQWETPTFGTDWTATPPDLLWRRPMGGGWSSFVVSGGRAITQEQSGDNERVVCLDLASGKELWSHVDPGVRLLLERAENGGAAMGGDGPRATPAIHEGKVYTMGATGIVNCLALGTGAKIWSRPLLRELGSIAHRWGMANSPLVLTNPPLVVFAGPDRPGPTLVACDPETGETRWTYEGSGASYSSPRLLSIGGLEQIVSVNFTDVSGIDPATGAELWAHPWPGKFPKVAQPLAVDDDRLLLTASYGAGSLLLSVKRDGSSGFGVEQLWKSISLKTKFSSAAVLGDHAYGLDEGRLACISLADGKRVWKKEKLGFGQHLRFGKWLLVQTEPGEVVLGSLSPAGFAESGRIAALSSMTWNAPAVAGRVLLVRNDREAAAYLLPPP